MAPKSTRLPVVQSQAMGRPLSFLEILEQKGGGGKAQPDTMVGIVNDFVLQAPVELRAEIDDWSSNPPPDMECLKTPPPSVVQVIEGVLDRRKVDPPFFRPSGFGGCRRSQLFNYWKQYQEPPQIDTTLAMILDTGTAMHTMVQAWLAEHPGVFFVKEAPVWLPELEIKGSSDGVLIFRHPTELGHLYRWGFEFKTISPKQFEELTKPKPAHIIQASIYARLMGVWWITIVYYCKGHSRLKEFHVQYDPRVWDMVRSRVAELQSHVQAGTLPEYDKVECRNAIDLCKYVNHCHSLDNRIVPKSWRGNR